MRLLRLPAILCCALPLLAETATTLTWKKEFGGSDYDRVTALTTDAQGNIYLAGTTTSMDLAANGVYTAPRGSNLYRLAASTQELEPLRSAVSGNVLAIATGSARSGVVYVSSSSGLMRSSDGGDAWKVLKLPPPPLMVWYSMSPLLATAYGLAVNPANPDVVYAAAGALGVLASSDGGNSWQVSLQIANASTIALDPASPAVLYATGYSGTPEGYRSDNGGRNWVKLDPPLSRIVPDAVKPGTIYGWSNNAILQSSDRGAAWSALPLPEGCASADSILSDPVLPPNLYLGCGGRLYRTRDQGKTWQSITPALESNEAATLGAVDPSLPLLYAVTGLGKIFRSADGGATWRLAAQGRPSYGGPLAALQGTLYVGSQKDKDGFAAKFTSNGDLVWATYLGGTADDSATAIAVNSAGGVYVAGATESNDIPVTPGAYDGGSAPGSAAYIVSLAPDGKHLEYAARLQVRGVIWSLAVDQSGGAYVAGTARGVPIVTTPGVVFPDVGYLPPCVPVWDTDCKFSSYVRPFLSKLSPGGSTLAYSTYIGGDWIQDAGRQSVAVDPGGNAYVIAGGLWKLNATAGAILYSTRLTGCDFTSVALDSSGNLIAGGAAWWELYTTPGVWKPWPDLIDGCLAKYDPRGQLIASTAMGAAVRNVAIAPDDTVLASGWLSGGSFYTKSLIEGLFDTGWMARLSGDFSQLQFSSFMRGDSVTIAGQPEGGIVSASSYVEGSAYSESAASNVLLYRTHTGESSAPRIDSIQNEADPQPSAISPRERIVVSGAGFGGAETRVLIGGIESEIVGRRDGSVTVVVPGPLEIGTEVNLVVESNGVASPAVALRVVLTTPTLYRAHPWPDTQSLAFNQDGTANSQSNPAARGSVLSFAVNGIGRLTPSGNSVIPSVEPVVFLGGQYALGVDANLLPAPGLEGPVAFLKVIVPEGVYAPNGLPAPVDLILNAAVPAEVSMTVWVK